MYRLQSIRKCYGSNVALDIEELTIAEGRLYTLTGGNGAGKSTLLSILAFLAPPTSGEIFYAGKRVDWNHGSVEEYRRKVTLLHQSPYLFGGSVDDNVAFGLKVRGIRGEERRRRIDEAQRCRGPSGVLPARRTAREYRPGDDRKVRNGDRVASGAGDHRRHDDARPGSPGPPQRRIDLPRRGQACPSITSMNADGP